MPLLLRILFVVNAVATLAAGVVLFLFPAAIPATVGIVLAPEASFVAWLLGASEFAIAALAVGALLSREPAVWRLAALTLVVLHAASAVADLLALLQGFTLAVAVNLLVRLVLAAALVLGLPRSATDARGE
jgi:hypothetical protein